MRKGQRIGILGGTFNPIHEGHVKVAEDVQKKFRLEKILFIPSYIPPHKESVDMASPHHRLRMIELAVSAHPQFLASSIEIEAKGKSYSIFTILKLKKTFPKAAIFFILGIDAFLEIDTWREYKKVLEQCYFVVVSRPGYSLDDAADALPPEYRERMTETQRTERIDDNMVLSYKMFLFQMESLDIASTEIRQNIRQKKSIKGLVPEAVEDYIRENKLYQINNE